MRDALHTKSLTAFLPAVHTNFNHSAASRLRDGMMLMLAFGRNATLLVLVSLLLRIDAELMSAKAGEQESKYLAPQPVLNNVEGFVAGLLLLQNKKPLP